MFLIMCNLLYFYFPVRPILWRLSFLILAIYAYFSKDNRPSRLEKGIFAFIVLNLFYYLISYLWISPETTVLGSILYSLSSFLLFPYLGRKGVLTTKFLTISCVVLTGAAIAYYNNFSSLAVGRYDAFDENHFTNNTSAVFLFLIPLLFCIKKGFLKYALLAIYIYFIISGVKRGNIIAAIIPLSLLVWFSLKDSKGSIWKTALVLFAIGALYVFSKNLIFENDFFLRRYEETLEGKSSNRDLIYAAAWELWYNAENVFNMIFGYGFDGTIHHLFNHYRAHSDWLEILVDYGLVGVLFYLTIFVSIIRSIFRQRELESRLILLSVLSIWFAKSLYSMAFSDEYLALMAIPLGVALSQSYNMHYGR